VKPCCTHNIIVVDVLSSPNYKLAGCTADIAKLYTSSWLIRQLGVVPSVDRHVVSLLRHYCLIVHLCLASLQDFWELQKTHWFWGFWPYGMWRRVLGKFVPDISKGVMLTPSKTIQVKKDTFWNKTKTAWYLETCRSSHSRTLPHIPPKLNPQQNFCGQLKHWTNFLIYNIVFHVPK
jgi:hypothetical protein